MPITPLVKPGTSAITEILATGNPQELQGRQEQQECLPQSGCKQQQSQATTVTSATSNIKETAISWPLTNGRNASNRREANYSRDNRNITASTAEGRPATARMPERRLTNNSTSISRDADSTIWTPKTHEFSRKKSRQNGENSLRKA